MEAITARVATMADSMVVEAVVVVAAAEVDKIRNLKVVEGKTPFEGETPPGGGSKKTLPRTNKDNSRLHTSFKCWLRPKTSPDLQRGLGEGVVRAGTAPIPGLSPLRGSGSYKCWLRPKDTISDYSKLAQVDFN